MGNKKMNRKMLIENSYINKSLVNAFKILECFNENEPSYTSRELSDKLKMNPSSTWRLIYTLEQIGYLYKKDGDRYCLGLKHVNFAKIIINNLHIRRIAKPFLDALSKETKFNVTLGILDREEVVYLDRISSPDIPDTYFHVGRRVPIYCTALGKVLLSFQSFARQEEIIKNIKMNKYTQNTIIDKESLKKEIKDVYANGYAVDNGEFINSVKCLAMPIHDRSGELVASVSISNRSLTQKDERDIFEYVKEVSKTARRISNEMGYNLFSPF
jgi:DNA-binding IclR family transcriptional regulator